MRDSNASERRTQLCYHVPFSGKGCYKPILGFVFLYDIKTYMLHVRVRLYYYMFAVHLTALFTHDM
jgi:hypothetical protein